MKEFNVDDFQNKVSDVIENLLKEVPDEWKAEMAGFISLQSIIFGADNLYEGIGIFEIKKQEYIDICDRVLSEDEINTRLN